MDNGNIKENTEFGFDHKSPSVHSIELPELSDWTCHLFGKKPEDTNGIVYKPLVGQVPNAFIRYMHKIILGSTWTKDKE